VGAHISVRHPKTFENEDDDEDEYDSRGGACVILLPLPGLR
jgi:hypothetical protein